MLFWGIGGAVFVSHFVEGVSGFGCMILALPVVSALLGIRTAVPLLVILSTLFDAALVWQDWEKIRWREVAKMAAVTSVTMPFGFLALKYLSENLLELLLGIFMVAVAVFGVYTVLRKSRVSERKNGKYGRLRLLFLPLAGLAQGAFGGSGPFMILYAQGVLKDKTVFRGTMAAVWVALNFVNLVQYQMNGMIDLEILRKAVSMIPFLLAGYVAGTWTHKRISEQQFNLFVYGILLVAGVAMAR